MKISGTITRLVAGKNRDGSDARVFIRPEDPAVLRKLDGAQYLASGEIAATGPIEGLEVGEEHEIDVPVEGEPAPAPVARSRSRSRAPSGGGGGGGEGGGAGGGEGSEV